MENREDNILGNAAEQSQEVESILNKSGDTYAKDEGIEEIHDKENIETEEQSIDDEEDIEDDYDLTNGEEGKYTRDKIIKLIGLGVLALILVVFAVILISNKAKKENKAEVELKPVENFELSTESKTMIDTVRKAIEHLYKSNAYITLHVGSEETDVLYLLYNKNKECYMESGFSNAIAVFRKDSQAVALTNPVSIVEDIHLLKLMERMIELIEKGYAEISIDDTTKAEVDAIVYNMIAQGKHNIRKLYTGISEEYANDMMNSLFGIGYTGETVEDDDTDCFVIQAVVGKDNEFGATAYTVIDGFEQYIWWFDGYMELDEYELDERWYNEDNSLDTWEELATALQSKLSENLDTYMNENLTDAEKSILEEGANEEIDTNNSVTNEDGLPILEFKRPEGELTEDERAWWDYIESIHKKILNNEELTEQEKIDYYSLPPAGEQELEE